MNDRLVQVANDFVSYLDELCENGCCPVCGNADEHEPGTHCAELKAALEEALEDEES